MPHHYCTMRPAAVALTVLAAPLLMAAVSSERTALEVEAQGWRKMAWNGIRPAQFTATPSGGIRVQGQGEGAFITRPLTGAATCLAWRWRVDAGPPPTDLTRRGGDDRALNIAIGFAEFGPGTGAMTRTQHAIAQASAGGHRLPRSILSYVWGGTGQEAQGGFFTSPWTAGITRMKVLRPATTPRGQWRDEMVDLGADWRASFGGGSVPAVLELVISTDTDDTGSPVDAQVENIRLVPCR